MLLKTWMCVSGPQSRVACDTQPATSPGFLPACHSGWLCSGLDSGVICFLKGYCFSWVRVWAVATDGWPHLPGMGREMVAEIPSKGGGDAKEENQGLCSPGLSSMEQLSF